MRRVPAAWLTPARVVYGFAALAGLVTLWNAVAYPPGAGYDAISHTQYIDTLLDHHRLPTPHDTAEYYSPPLYYILAAAATWVGRHLGLGEPLKLVQLLNVPAVVASVLVSAGLARVLWPRRPWLPAAAAGFVALSPVLMIEAAMLEPESLDLALSTLSLLLAARMLVARRYRLSAAFALGIVLGLAQMVRQFALWALAVVVLAWLAALLVRREERRELARALAVMLAAVVVVAGPWYGYRTERYGNAVFDRPHRSAPIWDRRPASFYLDPGLPDLFTKPYRPHMTNLAWPETYSGIWGDWFGVFDWSVTHHPRPSRAMTGWLVAQNVIGLVPTALALAGWLALLALGLVRRSPLVLTAALMPLAGLAGYLYFTISYPTADGDVLKASYMLATLGAWAVCFAWASSRLAARFPRVVVWGLVALALADLPFVLYKGAV